MNRNYHEKKNEFSPLTQAFILKGYSMMPCLNPKKVDVVLMKKQVEYNIGDVVIVKSYAVDFDYVIHRIVYIFENQERYITKGDNNLYLDDIIYYDDIIGKAEKYIHKKNHKIINITHSVSIARISKLEEIITHKIGIFGKIVHKINKLIEIIIVRFKTNMKGKNSVIF